jgi:hypothetical protein
MPGEFVRKGDIQRVQLAGGLLDTYAMDPNSVPLEYVFRKLPPLGLFTATSQRPVRFKMGSFEVPNSMTFLMLDTWYAIFRPSGVVPDDFVLLEDRRLSTSIGWDITVSSKHQGNFHYESIPSPVIPLGSQFNPVPQTGIATDDQFNTARQASNQVPGGGALAMSPQRHHRDGLMQVPYSWVAQSNEIVEMFAIAFNPVPIPVAFFESSITGVLLSSNAATEFLKGTRPASLPVGRI